jgi:AbrB family looped-hinge helix DNA binding protein
MEVDAADGRGQQHGPATEHFNGIVNGMRTTIDKAGRLVIPKLLRDQAGIQSGEVEVFLEGTGLHIEPVAGDGLAEEGGWLVIPASGGMLDDATVRAMLDAGRR